jgi:flagellar basal-body rod modification protein FlgD
MTTLPISSIAALAPQTTSSTSGSTSSTSSSGTSTAANLTSENVFLQLLVAQLKNQDPEQPTDGTQFVTELAQFTTLQEDTESATDLDKIVASLPSNSTTGTTTTTANAINQ